MQVGLFELDPSQLPASWNTQPGLLPPLGASPDAALVHKLTLIPLCYAVHMAVCCCGCAS